MARRRYDARCCVRFMLHSVLLGHRLSRAVSISDQRRAIEKIELAERVRQSDENDFIMCELRREETDVGAHTRMRPTFFDARKFWRRRGGSWVRMTKEGRCALRTVKKRRARRLDDAKKWQLVRPSSGRSRDIITLKEEVEAERLAVRRAAAREAFRARWPPRFVCTQCSRGFALPRAVCCGLETELFKLTRQHET